MESCFIRDCPNNSAMGVEGLRFLEFPQEERKKVSWMESISVHYEDHPSPGPESRICNGHFFRKDSQTDDPEHPSYRPLFFPSMDKEVIKEVRKTCKEMIATQEPPKTTKRVERSPSEDELSPPPKKSRPPPKSYRKITTKERSCCVVGCYNHTGKRGSIDFAEFPNHASNQYKAWRHRIRRSNPDGSPWTPSLDSVICSDHFYEGKISSSSGASFAPVFFPHNVDEWEDIRRRLRDSLPYVVKEEPLDYSNEELTLSYPCWMNEISTYVLDCQKERKFTDVIVSNGNVCFEGHRIILMSALPMIKLALVNLESYDVDEKTLILLPDMSSYEIEVLEKVVYSRGSIEAYSTSFANYLSSSNHSVEEKTRERLSERCPISEAVADEVKRAAAERKQVPAPIPVLELENKKLTSSDFFRLYNNVACRNAKDESLHETFLSGTSESKNINDDEDNNPPTSGQEEEGTDSAPEEEKPILDKIMKQVTNRRAVSPQKFTFKNAKKKYTVIMQTVKRPDPSSKPFPSLEEMQARRSARPSKPFCSACEKEFESHEERDKHKISHLAEEDEFPNSLSCKHCLKSFKTVEQKRIHETNHTKKGWKCEACDLEFGTAYKLLDHSFTHQTTSRFVCQYCSKGFRIKSKLLVHENMHRNVSKHKCLICPRIFVSATSLSDHINSHSGLRPYVCDKCGKSFSSSPSLSQHRSRVHNHRKSVPGRYKCRYCDNRFKTKDVLNNHMEFCIARPSVTILGAIDGGAVYSSLHNEKAEA